MAPRKYVGGGETANALQLLAQQLSGIGGGEGFAAAEGMEGGKRKARKPRKPSARKMYGGEGDLSDVYGAGHESFANAIDVPTEHKGPEHFASAPPASGMEGGKRKRIKRTSRKMRGGADEATISALNAALDAINKALEVLKAPPAVDSAPVEGVDSVAEPKAEPKADGTEGAEGGAKKRGRKSAAKRSKSPAPAWYGGDCGAHFGDAVTMDGGKVRRGRGRPRKTQSGGSLAGILGASGIMGQ